MRSFDGLTVRALDSLLAPTRVEEALDAFCHVLVAECLADSVHVYVVEPDDVHLGLQALAARDPVVEESLRRAVGSVLIRIDDTVVAALDEGGTVLRNDIQQQPEQLAPAVRDHVMASDVRHILGVAVLAGEHDPIGFLVLSRGGAQALPFAPEEVELAHRCAVLAGFALERQALRRRVLRQADILDQVGDAVVAVDEHRVVTKWNRGAETLYGIDRADALGRPLASLITMVDEEGVDLDAAWLGLSARQDWHRPVRQVTRDGRLVTVDAHVTALTDAQGAFAGAVAVNRDMAAPLEAQRELAERQAFAQSVLDALPGRTAVIGPDGRIRAVNAHYSSEGPFGAGEATGPALGADALAYLDAMALDLAGAGVLAHTVRRTLAGWDAEFAVDVSDESSQRWTSVRTMPFRGPGGGVLITFEDVSDRKARELELAVQATHDTLTGLPNRALLHDRLREALVRAHRRRTRVAVLFVDLDELKAINDTLGHAAGDEAIRETGRRLSGACRAGDTVARLGGDEFVVVLEDVTDTAEASTLARRLLDAVRGPVPLGGELAGRRGLSASMGVAVSDGLAAATEQDAEDLVRHADAAMLVAKRHGKDDVVLDTSPVQRPAEPVEDLSP